MSQLSPSADELARQRKGMARTVQASLRTGKEGIPVLHAQSCEKEKGSE